MRKCTQRGGSDMPSMNVNVLPLTGANLPVNPTNIANASKAPFIDYPTMTNAVSGGGKKKKLVKKTAETATKPVKAAKNKKGGSLVEDVKNLAVPFAILLAKEGIDAMFKSKAKSGKVAISARKSAQGGNDMKKMTGGDCPSCKPLVGGAKSKASRYSQLSKEIDSFLSKY